jgi:hypothetical protein
MSIARDEEVRRWAIRRTLALEIIQGKASVSEEGVANQARSALYAEIGDLL